MSTTNDFDPAPVEQLVGPDAVLYSTVEVGRLIRWLNELCVKKIRDDDEAGAKLAASLSASIEDAWILFEKR